MDAAAHVHSEQKLGGSPCTCDEVSISCACLCRSPRFITCLPSLGRSMRSQVYLSVLSVLKATESLPYMPCPKALSACTTVRACVRATSRARQINRASPVRGSRNQAEAKAIWADFPPAPAAPPLHASRVSRARPGTFCRFCVYV